MAKFESSTGNRFKFAYFLQGWTYEEGDRGMLRTTAKSILASEYQIAMKGAIFCPECCVGVFRSPEQGDKDLGGRSAYFAHSRKHHPPCGLRVRKREGQRFTEEEEAKQAVDDGLLVVVKQFMKQKPVVPVLTSQVYDGPIVEDVDGELADVPIPRHNGEVMKLPSRITTVRALCKSFDKNYHKYYILPGAMHAQLLSEMLVEVSAVRDVNLAPRLYYGKIRKILKMGEKKPWNIQMTRIEYLNDSNKSDFTLKMSIQDSIEHGITDAAIGRIIMMYGPIARNGSGLAIENLGWGEFSLLPIKYDSVLFPSSDEIAHKEFYDLLAAEVGLSLQELEGWMDSDEAEITDDGVLVGHIVNFRRDTPDEIMCKVEGRTGDYSANVGIIYSEE
jgi:hypothetical protein